MTMKNKEVRQSIAMVILLTIGFMLVAGCSSSSGGYEGSAFYYQQPQFVHCADSQVKICEQYGSKMICECLDEKEAKRLLNPAFF